MIDVGCADGYRSIADIYVNGIGNVKASFEEAYKWYQKGIIAGDIKSYKGIADIYKNGKCGARKDYFKAAEWYEKGANAGDTDCYYELGCIYEEGGNDLKKDVDKAIYWLDRAYEFDNENFDAAIDLAILYAKKGGDKNEAESKKYLNKLQSFLEKIGESHWTLYLPLARIYELLTKNDENRQAALKCYCKAISAGNASAICEACRLYFVEGGLKLEGITEEKLFNKLYNYVMKEKSDEAYYLIGYCYKNGLGTKKNRFQAKAYLKKAADKGHRQAAKELESFLF